MIGTTPPLGMGLKPDSEVAFSEELAAAGVAARVQMPELRVLLDWWSECSAVTFWFNGLA